MESKKDKKCDECFEIKPDVKMRGYEVAEIPLCDSCFEQNMGTGQEAKEAEAGE